MGHESWFMDPRVRFIGHVPRSHHTDVDTGNWRMYTGHAYFYTPTVKPQHAPFSRAASLQSTPVCAKKIHEARNGHILHHVGLEYLR